MTYFLDNPEYAMILIDSAYIDENISDLKRQYLKAIVMYNGFSHPDSSAVGQSQIAFYHARRLTVTGRPSLPPTLLMVIPTSAGRKVTS